MDNEYIEIEECDVCAKKLFEKYKKEYPFIDDLREISFSEYKKNNNFTKKECLNFEMECICLDCLGLMRKP
jgi:hypothetical protein